MNPSAIAEELPHYFNDRMTVFLKGPPGVGKSDIVRQVGAAMKLEVRDWMRASQMDPTDVKGLTRAWRSSRRPISPGPSAS